MNEYMDAQAAATKIVKKLVDSGYTAYFAGGWVRDHLMGHPSDDIDIATDAHPEKIIDLFPRTILVGFAFGIVVVVMDGHQFEVATFRKDIDYLDGRKPSKIELSSAEEDACRRDFTINGMFYDPIEHVIHDFVHGAEDIAKRVIRTIGNADERFVEDRLRMIRAVRFAARFEFSIEPETQEAIAANADTLFPAVARERIWQEMTKMSKSPRFDMALIEMHRLQLLPVIFPSLKDVHLHQIKSAVAGFKNFPKNAETILYIMVLFPALTVSEARDLCHYLRTSNAEAHLAEFLVLMRQYEESEHALAIVDLHDWARLYAHPAAENCLQIMAAGMNSNSREEFLSRHSQRKSFLKRHIDRIIEKKPLVNASVLKAQGVSPGKAMGILIREAERLAIFNDLNDVESTLAMLKATHAWLVEKQNETSN